jgi:hypothetical protein
MTRPASQAVLLQRSEETYGSLLTALDLLPEVTRSPTFQADVDNQSRSPRDILAHLHAWQRLFLGWYGEGMTGGSPAMPASGFSWRQTPQLNAEIWAEFRDSSYPEVRSLLDLTHHEVRAVVAAHGDVDLFTKGRYRWVGGTTLGSLLVSVTSSHYEWGLKTARDIRKTLPTTVADDL